MQFLLGLEICIDFKENNIRDTVDILGVLKLRFNFEASEE